jgi:hypothetical protein
MMRRLFRGNDEERKDKEQVGKMKIACDVQGILTVIMPKMFCSNI